MPHDAPLVAVVGAGVIGLSCAAALSARGARVLLVGESHAGESSPAAAGMLAPHIESNDTPARALGVAARDRFPDWIAALEDATGVRIALLRNGVLELAPDDAGAMRARRSAASQWLEPDEVRALEPQLVAPHGALLHQDDGAVDNVALVEALRRSVMRERQARVIDGEVVRISPGGLHPAIVTRSARYEVDRIVLAAGAWVNGIQGLPAPLPVEPLRGQMLALAGAPVGHVVYAPGVYLVPRAGTTLAGATMERVGFEVATTPDAQQAMQGAALDAVPALRGAPVLRAWSGLRPATPDLLPIVDVDPGLPALIYACGHSRNGILLAPLTGEAVADLAFGVEPAHDLAPFTLRRFRPQE
ncbi:MAG TPA: FAD-dependent oxidoreductase [Gemmatimonadaceae bacterium]|nr:FAD-dependent oxidoreductase [Gemmatimonadaceae bacterium]